MAGEKNMIRGPRIRSGGQTGVDRAALDAAMLTGRAYEGWCPKGGWAEDFPHPPGLLTKYPYLTETASQSPGQRTEWNVRDSAATAVLVPRSDYRSPGTGFTIECTRKYGKPCHIIYFLDDEAAGAIKTVISRLGEDQSLNIAGPRESEHPGAYERCLAILVEALALRRGGIPSPRSDPPRRQRRGVTFRVNSAVI